MKQEGENKLKPVKVLKGRRYKVEVQIIEISQDKEETIKRVIPISFWFFNMTVMTISLLALVLQIASMIG